MTEKRVSLKLTPEQQQAVKALTGRDAEAIELGERARERVQDVECELTVVVAGRVHPHRDRRASR